ncbi:MAG: 16S rRNA (cytosine(1402)-N(4))-methyltransferase RsmH [Mycoplasmataceae bacterium]|jgi:16S rRNA (cytosine1402-N4)-methyltransferase|nr:16S rRNA (cytosine(1402)-N(4))-methyltransferase RsmH [Mycoplasmataceae bacterium]
MIPTNSTHIPVLLTETIDLLNIKPNGIYVDCTAGLGGHSKVILDRLDQKGKLICIDQDQTAVDCLNKLFSSDKRVQTICKNFSELQSVMRDLQIVAVNGILVDLGVSSPMFDDPTRGFSYHNDGPLDMRMNQNQKLDARFIVNNYDAKQLYDIFGYYGEIYNSKAVVNGILEYRKHKSIDTTLELVKIIKDSVPPAKLHEKKHPARNYFQALRIAVNDELRNIKQLLKHAFDLLASQGRMAVISFHSLEDRIVKHEFLRMSSSQIPKEVPIMNDTVNFELITKHPVVPTEAEIARNRRARSAKLRVIERK